MEDLGKFGLGLKTASLSQCRRLTVASRHNENRADIASYCWDIDHIEATNRWEILPVKSTDLPEKAFQHLKETTGTVVIWESLDRIMGYKRPDGETARKQLLSMCRELEEYLAMVFHRFLAGEVRGKRLTIMQNGQKIEPWDPFARRERHTVKLEQFPIRVEYEKGKSDIVFEPFILPPQHKFSSPEAFNLASGSNKWNRQQGFYIYRADRMIQSGGWSNLRTLDEHNKLARVAVFFSPKLDEEFKINVPKMRVFLPASIKEDVARLINPVIKMANEVYRKASKEPPNAVGDSSSAPLPPLALPLKPHTPANSTNTGFSASSTAFPKSELTAYQLATAPLSDVRVFSAKELDRPPHQATSVPRIALQVRGPDLDRFSTLLLQVADEDELPVIRRVLEKARLAIEGG